MPNVTFRIGLLALILSSVVLARGEQSPEKVDGSIHRASNRDRQDRSRAETIRKMRRPSRRVALGALTEAETKPVSRKSGLVPSGISRALPGDSAAAGEWGTSGTGTKVWRLAVESTGAEAVRVKFTDFHVGAGSVWVLGDSTVGPYTGDGPFGDGEFWSDIVTGQSVVIAYEPAADSTGDAVPFVAAEVSHRFRKAAVVKAEEEKYQATAASCTVDVTCKPEYAEPASAVALMIFESGGESYECTGALIASSTQPAVPFFATANHCVATAEEAKSLIALFNYQTPDCNGTPPTFGRLPRVTGATVVSTHGMSEGDFSLLQLSAFPSIDVKVLGWSGETIASNANVIGISHPLGDYKRIALGSRTRDLAIRFSDGARMPASVGYQVAWFEGVTQSGSSGSPLLVNMGGKEYFVGTLSAGPDVDEDNSAQVCRTRNLVASYGRFAAVYPAVSRFLTSTSAPNTAAAPGLRASPATLAATPGQVTLSWTAPAGVRLVLIRVGSATGPAMTGTEGPTGSVQTGNWVIPGTTFFLQDATDGNSFGSSRTIATVRIDGAAPSVARATLTAGPNPIVLSPGQPSGRTTLTWEATGVTRVQIRIGSPNGPAMTGLELPTGSAATGNWVSGMTTFYLQNASDGSSLGTGRTLATVTVRTTR